MRITIPGILFSNAQNVLVEMYFLAIKRKMVVVGFAGTNQILKILKDNN